MQANDTSVRPNILCVEAHPDDVVHGMGGTACKLKDRYQLHICCLTRGQRGISGISLEETAAIRTAEETAACALLGAEVTFMNEMDQELFAHRALCEEVADLVRRLQPVAVFTLWPINVPDHAAAHEIAVKALHLAGTFFTTELYMMENGIGGQTNQFEPDLYVNISDVIDDKLRLAACHKSQWEKGGHGASLRARSATRGQFARCEHAEPFKTYWPLMGTRWERKTSCLLWDL